MGSYTSLSVCMDVCHHRWKAQNFSFYSTVTDQTSIRQITVNVGGLISTSSCIFFPDPRQVLAGSNSFSFRAYSLSAYSIFNTEAVHYDAWLPMKTYPNTFLINLWIIYEGNWTAGISGSLGIVTGQGRLYIKWHNIVAFAPGTPQRLSKRIIPDYLSRCMEFRPRF